MYKNVFQLLKYLQCINNIFHSKYLAWIIITNNENVHPEDISIVHDYNTQMYKKVKKKKTDD